MNVVTKLTPCWTVGRWSTSVEPLHFEKLCTNKKFWGKNTRNVFLLHPLNWIIWKLLYKTVNFQSNFHCRSWVRIPLLTWTFSNLLSFLRWANFENLSTLARTLLTAATRIFKTSLMEKDNFRSAMQGKKMLSSHCLISGIAHCYSITVSLSL